MIHAFASLVFYYYYFYFFFKETINEIRYERIEDNFYEDLRYQDLLVYIILNRRIFFVLSYSLSINRIPARPLHALKGATRETGRPFLLRSLKTRSHATRFVADTYGQFIPRIEDLPNSRVRSQSSSRIKLIYVFSY